MKDTTFYNAESGSYSAKRYPEKPVTFTQFFFKERLRKALLLIGKNLTQPSASVLEVGTADGVVARAVWDQFPQTHSKFDAVDISPDMIAVATKRNGDTSIHFAVRKDTTLSGTYDLVFELGVLNYLDIDAELPQIQKVLAPNGRYICSVSGVSALQHRLKGSDGYKHLRSYAQYEKLFATYFTIEQVEAVGFFIPFVWKFPVIGRFKQPILEWFWGMLAPSLALEKIYVLSPKH